MELKIIQYFLGLLLVQPVYTNIKLLKDDSGNTDISLNWRRDGECTASWAWENGAFSSCVSDQAQNVQQDCRVYSGYYPSKNVNMVYVRTSLVITKCIVVKKKKTDITLCDDFVRLEYYSGDNPGKSTVQYQYVSDIPENPKFTSPIPNFVHNTTVVGISDVSGKAGVKLAFRAKQFCGGLKKVEVFYYVCPASTSELVTFTEQPAPSKSKASVEIYGTCTMHALKNSNGEPKMVCRYDGTYNVTGSCICDKGYEKVNTECLACPSYKYKPTTGNQKCLDCGENSKQLPDPKLTCECLLNFFKALNEKENFSADCHRPPDKPTGIKVETKSNNHVTLSWNAPSNSGDKPLGGYVVECLNCPPTNSFKVTTNELTVNISGLGAYANYSVAIYNDNEITQLTGNPLSAEFSFQTHVGAPSVVRNVVDTTNSDGSVTYTWDEPFSLGGPNVVYVIKYGGTTIRTQEKTATIPTGTQDKTYNVEIFAEVSDGGVVYQGPAHASTVRVKGGISLTLAIGVAVGVILFIVIVLIAAFCFWRKQHPPYLQVVRMEDGTVKLPSHRFISSGKLYVDPTTYNDVDDAVQEFAYELERKDLKIAQLLGGGEFAEVYKGELFKNGKKRPVAIKTLKAGASKKDRDDFLGEAAILGQFNDANVVSLEGVILRDRPNVIVLEFMCNGALDKYLQENDNQFTILQLLGMARGVASGMKYLSELGFIHRDLAARNILVNEHKICKVSDFGMSREIKVDETYDTQGGKIPVRWTAPEAIQYKKFTTSSDVWSYGVLLWEIASYGERPYWDWGNYEVLERINAGYRLPPPMSCPKVLHDLMLYCWNKDRTKRPKFGEVRDQLEKWIRSPDLLQEIASVITKRDENLDYTVLQTTHKWLEAIGMAKYTSNFVDQGFATPRQILELTLEDLEALGVSPIGHRKKIYKAIENTKIQVEARHNSVSGRRKTNSVSKRP